MNSSVNVRSKKWLIALNYPNVYGALINMNVAISNTIENPNTLGLGPLNPDSFSIMQACGHRIVSIQQQTTSKFIVNTECTSGIRGYDHENCKGSMQFSISPTGVNLYLGKFTHNDECRKKSGFESGTIEDITSANISWQEPIAVAKKIAETEFKKAEDDRIWVLENCDSYVCTPFEVNAAEEVLDSVKILESMFLSYNADKNIPHQQDACH